MGVIITLLGLIVLVLFPTAPHAASTFFPHPSALPTTLTQPFHFRYECPAEGCNQGDLINLSLTLKAGSDSSVFTPASLALRWIELSTPTTILTPTKPATGSFTGLVADQLELGLAYPSGAVLVGEVLVTLTTLPSSQLFFDAQPTLQLDLTNSIAGGVDSFTAPIPFYLPLSTTTTTTTTLPFVTTPQLQFTHTLLPDTTIPVDPVTKIPTAPIIFNQFTITLPKPSASIKPQSMHIFPMHGLVFIPPPSTSPQPTCVVNSVLYQAQVKRTGAELPYIELVDLNQATLSALTIQCFISTQFTDQNSMGTVYPSNGNNFGLIVALYPTPTPPPHPFGPTTIPPTTSTDQIITHWFRSYSITPQTTTGSGADGDPVVTTPPSWALHTDDPTITIITYPASTPTTLPALQVIQVLIDPPQMVRINNSTAEVVQYDGVNNFVPTTPPASTFEQLDQYTMIHTAHVFRFNTNETDPTGLSPAMLENLSIAITLDWDSITLPPSTPPTPPTPPTTLPEIQTYPNLRVHQVSWVLYATIEYQASINGFAPQLYSTDIPINTDFLHGANATTATTTTTFQSTSNWSSEVFNLLPLTLINVDHVDALFSVPDKIITDEQFVLLATTFTLSFDIISVNPIVDGETTMDMSSFNPTLTLASSYNLAGLGLTTTTTTSTMSSTTPPDFVTKTITTPIAILTSQLPGSLQSAHTIAQSTGLEASPTATLPSTQPGSVQPNWSTAVLNATIALYPHQPPQEIEYDPARFASRMRPDVIQTVATTFPTLQSFTTLTTPLTHPFTPQQIIDEETPIPDFKQYTFKMSFYSNQPKLDSITLTIQSGQFAFFGNFNQPTCTLNGVSVTSVVDTITYGPVDNIDDYYHSDVQPDPTPYEALNPPLVNPNMYQSITFKIPDGIADLTVPVLSTVNRVGLDGKVDLIDYGPNPPNFLKCMAFSGTIVDISSLYQFTSSVQSDTTGDPGDDVSLVVEFPARTVPVVPLPHFNPNLDYLTQIPIILIAHPPEQAPPSGPAVTAVVYPAPLYDLNYGFTAVATIPPQPEPTSVNSKATWIIITVVTIVALIIAAAIPSTRFVMKNFCNGRSSSS